MNCHLKLTEFSIIKVASSYYPYFLPTHTRMACLLAYFPLVVPNFFRSRSSYPIKYTHVNPLACYLFYSKDQQKKSKEFNYFCLLELTYLNYQLRYPIPRLLANFEKIGASIKDPYQQLKLVEDYLKSLWSGRTLSQEMQRMLYPELATFVFSVIDQIIERVLDECSSNFSGAIQQLLLLQELLNSLNRLKDITEDRGLGHEIQRVIESVKGRKYTHDYLFLLQVIKVGCLSHDSLKQESTLFLFMAMMMWTMNDRKPVVNGVSSRLHSLEKIFTELCASPWRQLSILSAVLLKGEKANQILTTLDPFTRLPVDQMLSSSEAASMDWRLLIQELRGSDHLFTLDSPLKKQLIDKIIANYCSDDMPIPQEALPYLNYLRLMIDLYFSIDANDKELKVAMIIKLCRILWCDPSVAYRAKQLEKNPKVPIEKIKVPLSKELEIQQMSLLKKLKVFECMDALFEHLMIVHPIMTSHETIRHQLRKSIEGWRSALDSSQQEKLRDLGLLDFEETPQVEEVKANISNQKNDGEEWRSWSSKVSTAINQEDIKTLNGLLNYSTFMNRLLNDVSWKYNWKIADKIPSEKVRIFLDTLKCLAKAACVNKRSNEVVNFLLLLLPRLAIFKHFPEDSSFDIWQAKVQMCEALLELLTTLPDKIIERTNIRKGKEKILEFLFSVRQQKAGNYWSMKESQTCLEYQMNLAIRFQDLKDLKQVFHDLYTIVMLKLTSTFGMEKLQDYYIQIFQKICQIYQTSKKSPKQKSIFIRSQIIEILQECYLVAWSRQEIHLQEVFSLHVTIQDQKFLPITLKIMNLYLELGDRSSLLQAYNIYMMSRPRDYFPDVVGFYPIFLQIIKRISSYERNIIPPFLNDEINYFLPSLIDDEWRNVLHEMMSQLSTDSDLSARQCLYAIWNTVHKYCPIEEKAEKEEVRELIDLILPYIGKGIQRSTAHEEIEWALKACTKVAVLTKKSEFTESQLRNYQACLKLIVDWLIVLLDPNLTEYFLLLFYENEQKQLNMVWSDFKRLFEGILEQKNSIDWKGRLLGLTLQEGEPTEELISMHFSYLNENQRKSYEQAKEIFKSVILTDFNDSNIQMIPEMDSHLVAWILSRSLMKQVRNLIKKDEFFKLEDYEKLKYKYQIILKAIKSRVLESNQFSVVENIFSSASIEIDLFGMRKCIFYDHKKFADYLKQSRQEIIENVNRFDESKLFSFYFNMIDFFLHRHLVDEVDCRLDIEDLIDEMLLKKIPKLIDTCIDRIIVILQEAMDKGTEHGFQLVESVLNKVTVRFNNPLRADEFKDIFIKWLEYCQEYSDDERVRDFINQQLKKNSIFNSILKFKADKKWTVDEIIVQLNRTIIVSAPIGGFESIASAGGQ